MSIQSTLKTISMADKMSVAQLQQAVKSGTIPAYIAVPLIQERMKDKQEAQGAAAAGQPQQPPVAQQVMAQADQDAIASLPAGMPAEYAHGGIVAFAEGDLVDDDEEDDDYADALLQAELMKVEEMPKSEGLAAVNRTPATGLGYGQVQGQQLRAARQPAQGGAYDAKGHKYDDLATTYAEQIGLNPALARYALKKETGGLKNPDSAVSKAGAIGPMQLMPATAKGLGVDPRDPAQNVMGGVKYLKQMVDKYGDERLALAAYNAGPGRVDAALRSERGIAGLPAETMRYIGMAGGGIVAFAGDDESLVKSPGEIYDTVFPEDASRIRRLNPLPYIWHYGVEAPANLWGAAGKKYADYQKGAVDWLMESPKESEKKKNEGIGLPAAIQAGTNPRALENQSMASQKKYTEEVAKKDEAPAAPAAPVAPEAPKEPDAFEKYMGQLREEREGLRSRADQDRWMGLLGAGLGMMAGKSQNPLENIGQGAMYGLGQYAQSRKTTAAEQAALNKAEATALGYKSVDEYRKAMIESQKQSGEERLAQKTRSEAADDRERFVLRQTEIIKGALPKDPTLWTPDQKAQYEAAVQKIYTMPGYIALDRLVSPSAYAGFKVVK